MYRGLILFASVAFLALFPFGGAGGQTVPKGIVPEPAKQGIGLELLLNRTCFVPKERLVLGLKLDRPAHVYVYNIDVEGKVWLLFPNAFSRESLLGAGTHLLPDSDRYSIVIQGPAGLEYVQAIASPVPIPVLEFRGKAVFRPLGEDAAAFAKALAAWLEKNLPEGGWATDWAAYGVSLGKLIVRSFPPEVEVYIDGHFAGLTHKEKEGALAERTVWLRKGYHRVEVRKEGFEGQARTVYIEPCKVRELTFRLIMPATLRIISDPPGAEAYVDEKYCGKTPLELVLEPGDHWIELRFRGGRFEPWSRWIHLRPGEEKTLRALIPPRVGIPPEAVFWFSPEEPLTGEVVVFDASASRDPDGWIVSYSWDFDGDGEPDAEGARVTCVFGEPGIHRVRLTVTDYDGFTDSVEFSFRVRARPVAAFTAPERAFVGEPVKFDASPSHDPDGRIVSYHWDFGDGEEATGSAVEHAFAVPGTYRVTLTVRDDDGLTGEASREIEVVRGGEISISSDPPGAEVYLDGRHIGTTPLRTEKLPEGTTG